MSIQLRIHANMRGALTAIALGCALAACGENNVPKHEDAEVGAASFERGPHRGRMLRTDKFTVEVTIFETNIPPEFRVYAYLDNKPVDPQQVRLSMSVTRLGNKVDRFTFAPQDGFLRAQSSVHEPHSFDVGVAAEYGGKRYAWTYATYEGRTTIAREATDAAGVKVETAGAAVIEETIDLTGRVELVPEGRADVRAWYPGRIVAMTKSIGDKVRRGEVLARVESAASLQTYPITAPFDGVIAEQNANVGGVAGDGALYVIVDRTKLHAELTLFPKDAGKIKAGQNVEIVSASGDLRVVAKIESILASAANMPTLIAHVRIPADSGDWFPGMGVRGVVTIGSEQVPLAVRTSGLQRFRDFTVVYARVDNTYEVRMLELGRQTPEWTEIKGGIDSGETYVSENAFLIRADIEKSGAVHDH